MKEPKVELKSLKFHQGHEWDGFKADVFINGVKCMHVKDDGNGGCLDFDILAIDSKNPELINALVKELDDYIETIPEKTLNFGHGDIKDENGNVRLFKVTLEDYINELVTNIEREKTQKKLVKLMETAIVIGIPNGNSYRYRKFNVPLSKIPFISLQSYVDKTKKSLKDGEVIFNTNLEALGIK
jgi:hypothetical protein